MLTAFLWMLVAVLLHEAGHALAALLLGLRIKGVTFRLWGVGIVREQGPPVDSLIVSAAGPLINVACAALAGDASTFAVANWCVGLVNLLPISGSDGSHILACLHKIENLRIRRRCLEEYTR